jgi:hypothetical protein
VLLDWCANEVSDLLVQLTHFLLHFFRIFLRTQNGLHRDERARSSTDTHFLTDVPSGRAFIAEWRSPALPKKCAYLLKIAKGDVLRTSCTTSPRHEGGMRAYWLLGPLTAL